MTSQLMVEPSSLMYSGIVLNAVQDLHLFKFTDELQARSDELLEKILETGLLTSEEEAELAGISDLARIFTYANTLLADRQKWSQTPSENLSEPEPKNYVNTATHQNL